MPLARVVLLAGPSGSGKSYVAHRSGLPVLCLDDFYRDGSDPSLPRTGGQVDWDSPRSWDLAAAMSAIETLCLDGQAQTPIYAFGQDRQVGVRTFALDGAQVFIAEGIFAAEIAEHCHDRGLLAAAYTLRRPRGVTYIRRLTRDLAERRKRPGVLIRRGFALLLTEPTVLARAQRLGAQPASARDFLSAVRRLNVSEVTGTPDGQPHLIRASSGEKLRVPRLDDLVDQHESFIEGQE